MDNDARSRPAGNLAKLGRLGRRVGALPTLLAIGCLLVPAAARAQDYFLGQIIPTGFNFAPTGWALCQGQILPIASNTALFSLLGTTYGGNGTSNFALPDLRGRISLEAGQGPGLTDRFLGELGGEEYHTLTTGEMPVHSHAALADSGGGTSDQPGGMLLARNAAGMPQYGRTPSVAMHPSSLAPSGGGLPHENRPPYLAVNYIIALQGIYPAHSAPTVLPQHAPAKPAPSSSRHKS